MGKDNIDTIPGVDPSVNQPAVALGPKSFSEDPREAPFTQEAIDNVRFRVQLAEMASLVVHSTKRWLEGKDEEYVAPVKEGVEHVWFPRPTTSAYASRTGNPPADVDRPAHLRGKHLVIDWDEVGPEAWAMVAEAMMEHVRSKYSSSRSRYAGLISNVTMADVAKYVRPARG